MLRGQRAQSSEILAALLVFRDSSPHNPIMRGKIAVQFLCGLSLLLASKAMAADPTVVSRDPRYPAHWWTPVPTNGAPSWEILPQEAGPGEVILSKRNELGLLSNFAPTPFTFHGKKYASLEGFWQMMKYPEGSNDARATFPGLEWKLTREQVSQLTAFDAKHAGSAADANMKKMGITWVTFEGKRMEPRSTTSTEYYKLIVDATREKVRENPEVQKVLLATGDLVLKPRPPSGTGRRARVALLRYPHGHPCRTTETPGAIHSRTNVPTNSASAMMWPFIAASSC